MNKEIYILAVDTSCDDTAVAILYGDRLIANVISSQIEIHEEWGGVVPNLARRAHEENIDICIAKALKKAKLTITDIDVFAVTYGPGLAPALQVGVKRIKELALENKKPLIAVNHMEGHLLSSLIKNSKGKYYSKISEVQFPVLSLNVSGGHTELVFMKDFGKYEIIGETLDDAAGEAFDKVGRMLGLGYPAGPVVEELAKTGNATAYSLPRPMAKSGDLNFSFSGLKTACLYNIKDLKEELGEDFSNIIPDYCASLQAAIIDTLVIKLRKAILEYKPKLVLIGGGVIANNKLRFSFRKLGKELNTPIYFPAKSFCMDNAAMIGLAAYYKYLRQEFVQDIEQLDRRPSLVIGAKDEFEL